MMTHDDILSEAYSRLKQDFRNGKIKCTCDPEDGMHSEDCEVSRKFESHKLDIRYEIEKFSE